MTLYLQWTIILFIECLKIAGNRSALYYWLNLKKDSADMYWVLYYPSLWWIGSDTDESNDAQTWGERYCFWFLLHHKQFKFTVCYYHVTYEFQSESTLYSCLNVKELLARSRRYIWSLVTALRFEPTTT